MKNRIAFGLTALLILAAFFAWHQPSSANESVILGEPAQGTAVSPSTPTPPPRTIERPSGSIYLFLPIVLNQSLSPEAQAVVDLINAERVKEGCAPLQVNSKLVAAAQGHSEDMAFNDFFLPHRLEWFQCWATNCSPRLQLQHVGGKYCRWIRLSRQRSQWLDEQFWPS